MIQTDFKIGDMVIVIDDSSRCGHYLRKGAIVTIVEIDDFKVNATVQGDFSSFRDNDGGWKSILYGPYCQCIGLNQIAYTNQCLCASIYSNPQLPTI